MKKTFLGFSLFALCIGLSGCTSLEPQPMDENTPPIKINETPSSAQEPLTQLFRKKYPKYADTLSVRMQEETQDHARGGVIFVPGAPGGYFLAARIDGEWEIILDGNGQIPCSLSEYGFPENMLSDCAKE